MTTLARLRQVRGTWAKFAILLIGIACWIATSEAQADVLQQLNYSYDNIGNVIGITDNVTPTNSQTLTYDDLDRLDSATGNYGYYDYAYDTIGNMTVNPQLGASNQAYAYRTDGTRPHAVCATGVQGTVTCPVTSPPYNYDANGNLMTGGGRTYAWNEENKPTSVTVGATTTTFVYDGEGGRVKKIAGSTTTLYVSKLYECDNGSCSRYIWAGSKRIAVIPDSPSAQTCNATQSPGGACYYHTDHLGSSSVVTDPTGTLVESISYHPYGEVKTDSPGTPVSVPYKYTGKEKDTSTGLYYYEARYYDPTLARFISADTIVPNPRDPQDLNRYTYAGNNPFKYTDPTGHFSFNIGKMFRRAFGDVGTALVGVAIQATGPFGMTMNAVLGSAVLTQSKTGRYVLAGEILVGTAVLSWECGGCGAYATGAAIGAWTGAAMGGYSAAQNGGDLSSGILFGSAIGAATGAAAGGLGSLGGGFGGEVMTNAQLLELGAFVSGKLAAGAIAGAGQGATTAYAGGRGNIGMIAQGALQGGLDGVKSSAIGVVGETSRFHTALTGAVKSNLYPGGRLAEVIGQTILNTTGLYSDLGTVGSLALDLQGGGLVDYVSGYVSGRVATADYRGEMALNNRMNRKFENEHSGAD